MGGKGGGTGGGRYLNRAGGVADKADAEGIRFVDPSSFLLGLRLLAKKIFVFFLLPA